MSYDPDSPSDRADYRRAPPICRHCRGRGWISAGIYGAEPCECEEEEPEPDAD